MAQNYKELLRGIQAVCLDYDGVFTDAIIYLFSDGELARTANVKDGYAVQYADKKGLRMAIITGGTQEAVRTRFEGLGVHEVYLGSKNKMEVLNAFCEKHSVDPEHILYMGDDIPDIPVLKHVGLATCPADAAPEVKAVCAYVSPYGGGKGCVRDILEQVLKAKGQWLDAESYEW